MMDGGMGSMMAWMMGFGLLGWTVVIALLVAILVVMIRLLNRRQPEESSKLPPPGDRPGEIQR